MAKLYETTFLGRQIKKDLLRNKIDCIASYSQAVREVMESCEENGTPLPDAVLVKFAFKLNKKQKEAERAFLDLKAMIEEEKN